MANFSELIRQNAYLEGGGMPQGQRSVDKIAQIFGTVKGVGDEYQDIVKNVLAQKKSELEINKERANQQIVGTREIPRSPEEISAQKAAFDQALPGIQQNIEARSKFLERFPTQFPENQGQPRRLRSDITEPDMQSAGFAPAQSPVFTPEMTRKIPITLGQEEKFSEIDLRRAQIGEKGKPDFKTASDMRQEFINRPEVKDFVVVNTNFKSMESLLQNALQGNLQSQVGLDQALITMFNKLSDPQSVVRESEYARTPENLPFVNRIMGAIDKAKAGGAGMTNEDRQALVQAAKIIRQERGNTFSSTRQSYENLAKSYGVDPNLVISTLPEYQVDGGQSASSEHQSAIEWANANPNDPRAASVRQKAQQALGQ